MSGAVQCDRGRVCGLCCGGGVCGGGGIVVVVLVGRAAVDGDRGGYGFGWAWLVLWFNRACEYSRSSFWCLNLVGLLLVWYTCCLSSDAASMYVYRILVTEERTY